MTLVKRWTPRWNGDGGERFLGHAGELDVYYEFHASEEPEDAWIQVYVVAPDSRMKSTRGYNFDAYDVIDGTTIVPSDSAIDVHVELAEMCEIYRLAAEVGAIELEADDA
jgi:hypothetical protein